jgi:DNA-binding MarR family transcriptional regulator
VSTPRYPVIVLTTALEEIVKAKGEIKASDLFSRLIKTFKLSPADIMKYLMILEIRGYISISSRENGEPYLIRITEYGRRAIAESMKPRI